MIVRRKASRLFVETGQMLIIFNHDEPVALGKANGYGEWHVSNVMSRWVRDWVYEYLRQVLKVPSPNIKRVPYLQIENEVTQL